MGQTGTGIAPIPSPKLVPQFPFWEGTYHLPPCATQAGLAWQEDGGGTDIWEAGSGRDYPACPNIEPPFPHLPIKLEGGNSRDI